MGFIIPKHFLAFATLFAGVCVISGGSVRATEYQVAESATLDGRRFVGLTGENSKGDHHSDTIVFADGKFRSLDCENWGFGPAPYSVEKDGDTYKFRSTLVSPDLGTLDWSGSISGALAEGAFRWTHKRWYGTINRDYWFKGSDPAYRD